MPKRWPPFLSELPSAPEYSPVGTAIAKTNDSEIAAALRLFASMPPSTGVLANPVRHHLPIACNGVALELNIRSFGIRGCLLEEDIVTGAADATRVIFVGLFGRFASAGERRSFQLLLSQEFHFEPYSACCYVERRTRLKSAFCRTSALFRFTMVLPDQTWSQDILRRS